MCIKFQGMILAFTNIKVRYKDGSVQHFSYWLFLSLEIECQESVEVVIELMDQYIKLK